jgi:hypothetical protein
LTFAIEQANERKMPLLVYEGFFQLFFKFFAPCGAELSRMINFGLPPFWLWQTYGNTRPLGIAINLIHTKQNNRNAQQRYRVQKLLFEVGKN